MLYSKRLPFLLKMKDAKSVILATTISLMILGAAQVPRIAFANPTVTRPQHFGPYASSSDDSGTCGNDWATDTFNRHFTVFSNPEGTFTVVEHFKDGTFITPASDGPPVNFSPGACQASPTPAGVVNNGIAGEFQGHFVIPLPSAETQTSTSPFCDAVAMTNTDCTTATFINTHFTPACYPDTCSVTMFVFKYDASDQGLIMNEWKNASPDRGGNRGDIRSSNL